MTDADPPILETTPLYCWAMMVGWQVQQVGELPTWQQNRNCATGKTMGKLIMCRRDGRFRFFVGRMYP